MDCAQTCNRLGAIFRGNRASYAGGELHYTKPLKRNPDGTLSQQVSDLQFDPDRVREGAKTIARRLRMEKKATTVFATHGDTFGIKNGDIDHPGTHFVTFVGCSAQTNDKILFLITDPWPGGSVCSYSSGIFGNIQSTFMGFMTYSERDHIIATTLPKAGSHNYRVIKGP
jgi:hypothetical protein